MRAILLVVSILFFNKIIYSQCPQSGIKVQSKSCENPKGLAVAAVSCTELKVKWSGNKEETYLIKAGITNAGAESTTTLEASAPVCDNSGNCIAGIAVEEGSTINWSVQGVCTAQGITTYSEPVSGPVTYIPLCKNVKEINTTTRLQVYPIPSKGTLTVNYSGAIDGTLQISIYDVNGKQVFTKSVTAASKTNNQYGLNLHTLVPGTYMLQTTNGSEVKQVKFVLIAE